MRSKNLTIMFTDMKGYTNKTSFQSRKELEKLIDSQDKIVLPVIERFGGRVVKTIGDAYMVVFESPTSAVLCGVSIQRAVKGKFKLRITLSMGEVNLKNGDVFGEAVNLAARMEAMAKAGGVYLSDLVYLAMNKNEVPVVFVGFKTFKGIPRKVGVYKVVLSEIFDRFEGWWATKNLTPVYAVMATVMGLMAYQGGMYLMGEEKPQPGNLKKGTVLSAEASTSAALVELRDAEEDKEADVSLSLTPTATVTPSLTPEVEEEKPRKRGRSDN